MASTAGSDGRSVGIEHAALAMLGLPEMLDDLGFNLQQRCCALAATAARVAAPGSERSTNRWLHRTSALGELLGIDFGALSDMALYHALDRLLGHQERIEDHLFARAQSLFDFEPTIALYDRPLCCRGKERVAAASLVSQSYRHGRAPGSSCPMIFPMTDL